MLRAYPLVPYNLLNYYIGASYRFTFDQACMAFVCTLPLAFVWVGIGGAIVKFRLVERGEISSDKYMPFVWSGISCAIVLIVGVSAAVSYKLCHPRTDSADARADGVEVSTKR